MNLPQPIVDSISDLARQCNLDRVTLFGSRARCDNRDEDIPTLLMFDVVDLDKPVQSELLEEIRKDGVVIYEKV